MRAERERRESVLRAEGEKTSSILIAEGLKAAKILEAEGEKASTILRAEAQKESEIKLAEGQAIAIFEVQKATAEGLKLINESNPNAATLTLKSLETFEKVANGQSTKLIIPSDIQNMAGITATIKELLNK